MRDSLVRKVEKSMEDKLFKIRKMQKQFNKKQNQTRNEMQIEARNDLILKILFHMFHNANYQINTKFLEIFVLAEIYQKQYQALYILQSLKHKQNSAFNKKQYSYLNMLIFQKSRINDQQSKRELIDVDSTLFIDANFQEYKRLIYETTNLVEKFWQDLKKNDYQMRKIINVGKLIVDNFLMLKEIYECILEEKPDYREIVILGIQFNQCVLNFEIEAIQQANYLKNLDQKLKITKLNQYGQHQTNEIGMVIAAFRPHKKTKIILANKFISDLSGYEQKEIHKKELNMLIPQVIANVHETLIKNFIFNEQQAIDTKLKRVWIKTCEGHIEPVQVSINACISQKKGLLLVAFIDPIVQIKKKNFHCKVEDSYFLITDEEGFILCSSFNFANDFMGSNSYISDIKINIDDMFHNLKTFKEDDLRNGVKTQMIFTFASQFLPQSELNQKKVDVIITQGTHLLSEGVIIKEIIFSIERASEIKQIKHTIQDLDYEMGESETFAIDEDKIDPHFGYGSDSSASSNSNSLKSSELLQTKQIIDFQKIPQSILNVRRAIILFFMTLAATSFAMLAVSIVSNDQFKADQDQVQRSIYLVGQLANMRLTFRLLVQTNYIDEDIQSYSFHELQQMMQTYYYQIKLYAQYMSSDKYKDSSQLNYYMRQNALQLSEIQQDGKITTYNTTFTIGIQQYLTKIENFMDMDQQLFKERIGTFKLLPQMSNLTIYRQNVWFLIHNGNTEIRNFCLLLADLYMEEGQSKEANYNMTVLIISVSCIGVTLIISLIFIPVTFALDNDEKEIVSFWMIIRDETKEEVLNNISEFVKFFQSENMDKMNLRGVKPKTKEILDQSVIMARSLNQPKTRPSSLQVFNQNNNHMRSKLSQHRFEHNQRGSSGIIDQFDNDDEEIMNNNILKNKKQLAAVVNRIMMNNRGLQPLDEMMNDANDVSRSYQDSIPNTMNTIQKSSKLDLSVYASTLNDKTTYLNETIDDMVQQKSEQSGEDLQKQLDNLFFYEKTKKSLIILGFSTIIIGFYLGSYFICANIFSQSAESFGFQKVTSRRGPCLSTSFNVLIETFTENKTQILGYSNQRLDDYVRADCSGFESKYLDYVKQPPSQFSNIQNSLIRMDDMYACEMTFKDKTVIQNCQKFMNGILMSGTRSAIQSSYLFITHDLISFQARRAAIRDQQFLDSLEFNDVLYSYMKLVLDFLIPITDKIRLMIDDSITEYLNFKMQQYIIIFSVFIVFLMVSLIIALKVVIRILKRVVFRSRILIKIIPTSELKRINQTLKLSKKEKN
ncbi:pas domain s-box family protein [Stylonychia lemnae]|uniref:Pas domain s-box family protein n=1 Tax=Stylonychia lemnae TaxID=5949 RepID=A0A078AWD5_STYLE|nr:pas domain s-box family protein [Stylonychia lemnae]|eukprot:CDW85118.1 pas domain s-box family protein [Stylonychia lemnae]